MAIEDDVPAGVWDPFGCGSAMFPNNSGVLGWHAATPSPVWAEKVPGYFTTRRAWGAMAA